MALLPPSPWALDWPLTRAEKIKCTFRLYEQDRQAVNQLLEEKEQQVRTLRRRSDQALAQVARLSMSRQRAPSLSPAPTPRTNDERPAHGDDTSDVAREIAMQIEYAVGSDHSIASEASSSPRPAAPPPPSSWKAPQASTEPESELGASPAARTSKADNAPFLASEAPASPAVEKKAAIPNVPAAMQRLSTPCRSLSDKLPGSDIQVTAPDVPAQDVDLQALAAEREAAEIAAALKPASDEEFLQKALSHYYQHRRIDIKGAEAAEAKAWELARQHAGEARAAELWSKIAVQDELPPTAVALWLARSLGPQGQHGSDPRALRWRRALMPTSRSLAFAVDTAAERRAGYTAVLSKASKAAGAVELRAEVQQEAKAAWRSEAFMALPGVMDAVASICLAASAERARHVRGTSHVAALLLFGLAMKENGDAPSEETLATAEVDAFWCLSKLFSEDQGALVDDCHDGGGSASVAAANSTKVMERRCQTLLKAHDPIVATLLNQQGLHTMPATRIGVAYCTRAGFSLSACAQIWDMCLADSRRFDLCDFVVVGLLLAIRHKLISIGKLGDAASLAEVLLTAPSTISLDTLIRTARALRALERRRARIQRQTAGQSGTGSSARSHRARSVPPVQGQAEAGQAPAPIELFVNFWSGAKEALRSMVTETVDGARNAVRCLPKGALVKGDKQDAVHEEEMRPLQRRSRNQAPLLEPLSSAATASPEFFAPPQGERPQQRTTTETPNQLLMNGSFSGRLLDI